MKMLMVPEPVGSKAINLNQAQAGKDQESLLFVDCTGQCVE